MQKHSENAIKIAAWLSTRDEVAWVNYPGLKTSKYNELAQKYLPKGQSGIVTFGLNKVFEAGKKVNRWLFWNGDSLIEVDYKDNKILRAKKWIKPELLASSSD